MVDAYLREAYIIASILQVIQMYKKRKFYYISFIASTIYCMNNNEITSKLSIAYIYLHVFHLVAITLCDKLKSIFYIEEWRVGAHSRVGTYLMIMCLGWALIRGGHFIEESRYSV